MNQVSVTTSFGQYAKRAEQAIAATGNGRRTFFDTQDFPWATRIEARFTAIRCELDRLLQAIDLLPGFEEIQVEQKLLTTDKQWKVFPLFAYGNWFEENSRRCPETVAALRNIPGLQGAMFSILQPHKELPPHRGPYKGILRYHLGVKIPQPETLCGIQVGEDIAHWQEGKSLIFDDSNIHSAWNRSNEDRVVLFVDFVRPLPPHLVAMNNQVIAGIANESFIINGLERWKQWETVYGNLLDEHLGKFNAESSAAET